MPIRRSDSSFMTEYGLEILRVYRRKGRPITQQGHFEFKRGAVINTFINYTITDLSCLKARKAISGNF